MAGTFWECNAIESEAEIKENEAEHEHKYDLNPHRKWAIAARHVFDSIRVDLYGRFILCPPVAFGLGRVFICWEWKLIDKHIQTQSNSPR